MTIQPPSEIYKFMNMKDAERVICNCTLKFSHPEEFNDPFDCNINLLEFKKVNHVHETIQSELQQLGLRFNITPEFSQLMNHDGFIEKMYKNVNLKKIRYCGISCFSLFNNNPVMCGLYADKQKGVCIGFNNKISNRFCELNEEKDISEGIVLYEELTPINYFEEERIVSIHKLFLRKDIKWQNEQEYRMITLNNKPQIQKIHPEFISMIYFGVNTQSEEINRIRQLCQNNNLKHVKFYKAKIMQLTMDFEQI